MDLDQFWYCGGIADDVYRELRAEELRYQPCGSPPPLGAIGNLRSFLVDWIVSSSKNMENVNKRKFALTPSTVHLAVHIMDLFLERNNVLVDGYVLTAATALVLAAKFEEKESHVPKLPVMSEHMSRIGVQLQTHSFAIRERQMLEFLDWHLMIPTAPLFMPYFLLVSDMEDDKDFPDKTHDPKLKSHPEGTPILDAADSSLTPKTPGVGLHCCVLVEELAIQQRIIRNQVEEDTEKLLEASLKVGLFSLFNPSKVAAVCLAVSRHKNGLPRWSSALASISMYSEEDLEHGFHELIRMINVHSGWESQAMPFLSPREIPLERLSPIGCDPPFVPTVTQQMLPGPIINQLRTEEVAQTSKVAETKDDKANLSPSSSETDGVIQGLVSFPEGSFSMTPLFDGRSTGSFPNQNTLTERMPGLIRLPSPAGMGLDAKYQQLGAMQGRLLNQQLFHTGWFLRKPVPVPIVPNSQTRPVIHLNQSMPQPPTESQANVQLKWVPGENGMKHCYMIIPGQAVRQCLPQHGQTQTLPVNPSLVQIRPSAKIPIQKTGKRLGKPLKSAILGKRQKKTPA